VRSRDTFRIAIRKFEPFESAIRKQWMAFESQTRTGLRLESEAFDLHPLQQSLFGQQGLSRGEWDVAFINTDWVSSIYSSGAVMDLSSYPRSDPPEDYPHGWTESLLRLQNMHGTVLGLPYHDGPECLLYRKDLFENSAENETYLQRFGTRLRPPKTWKEFSQIAHFFHRPQKHLYGTAFAAYPDGHNTVYDFLLQLWSRGGELLGSSGHLQFNTLEAVQALSFYRSMLQDKDAVHPASKKMDSVQLGGAFANGEVAMMVNWFGFAAMAETTASSKIRGKVGIAQIPHGETGSSMSLNIYWMLSIATGSPYRNIAYRFLRHCASREMDKLLTLEGGTGCRRSTWNDEEVNRIVPFYGQLEDFHAIAREVPQLAQWPHIASIIDSLVVNTIETSQPIYDLLKMADSQATTLFSSGDFAQ
jgi:multiple sugar transport system substrate-binding protein